MIFSKNLQIFTNIGKWLRRLVRIFFPNLINAIFREYSIISCQKKKRNEKILFFFMEKFYFENVKFGQIFLESAKYYNIFAQAFM